MPRATLRKGLTDEMKRYFPPRWRVSEVATSYEGRKARGTIKIRCLTDKKTFMSDFDAVLDPDGKIKALRLDGVRLTGRLACPSGAGAAR